MIEFEIYRICKDFVNLAIILLESGKIDIKVYIELTNLKYLYIKEYESHHKLKQYQ